MKETNELLFELKTDSLRFNFNIAEGTDLLRFKQTEGLFYQLGFIQGWRARAAMSKKDRG